MTVQDIASYLQECLGQHHPVEELTGILEKTWSGLGMLTVYGAILWNMKTDCTCIAGMGLPSSCDRIL